MTLAATAPDANVRKKVRTRWSVRVLLGLQMALALVVLIAVGFHFADAGRYLVTSPAPPMRVWLLLAGAVVANLFLARSSAWLRNGLLVAFLAALWLSCRAMPLGDGYLWRRLAIAGDVSWSEVGSTTLYAAVARWFGPAALEWLSPVAGLLSTCCWLHVLAQMRRASGMAVTAMTVSIEVLTWLSSGLLTVFAFGFVEHTQWAVPFLLLACGQLWCYTQTAEAATDRKVRATRRHLLLGVVWLTFAGAMHAQNLGLFVGVPMLIALRRRRAWAALAIDLLIALAGSAAVVGALLLAARGLGLTIIDGHVHGGADGRMFVPWGVVLAGDHWSLIGLVLSFAAPATVLLSLAVLYRPRAAVRSPADAGLALLALGYVAFVVLADFDLGWPQDVDLMVTMSPPLLLWGARQLTLNTAAAGINGRTLLSIGLILLCIATWRVAGPLLRASEATVEQTNGPNATLRIDGVEAERGALRRAASAPGDIVQVEILGPPGATWLVYEGPAHPGYGGFAYGGVVDLQLADAVMETPRVGAGVLDQDGNARFAYTVKAAPDGALLAIQAVVGQNVPGPVTVRFSAAAFFMRN